MNQTNLPSREHPVPAEPKPAKVKYEAAPRQGQQHTTDEATEGASWTKWFMGDYE